MTAVQMPECAVIDKWQILQDLSDGAVEFDLNHRTLGVLRALLTFHRPREISAEPLSAVVFPSNKTLAHRLNGMPESTLRRHLAQLVAVGVIIRHDSANRKRFKRGAGTAYGFDLAPLAQNADYISKIATRARDRRVRLANLRDEVAQMRQRVLDILGPSPLTEEARVLLRRTPDTKVLTCILTRLASSLNTPETNEMSGSDTENERHIQSDLSICTTEHMDSSTSKTYLSLKDILEQCKEYKLYFPQPIYDWQKAFNVAYQLSNMMGIDPSTFGTATKQIGQHRCIALIFRMLDNFTNIDNPNGYLINASRNTAELA